MKNSNEHLHCSIHGAAGQGIKNGHCEYCWPEKPITTIAQIIDLLEVEIAHYKSEKWMGRVEEYQKIIDYIKS